MIPTPAGCFSASATRRCWAIRRTHIVLTLRGAFRSEDSDTVPSQTTLTGATLYNPYDSRCTVATCLIFGNLPTVSFGNIRTASNLDQQYAAFNGSINKLVGRPRSEVRHELPADGGRRRRRAASAESAVCDDRRLRAIRRRHRRSPICSPTLEDSRLETTRFICATTTPHSSCRTTGNCSTT